MTPHHLKAATTFLGRIAQATGMPPGVDPSEKIATMAVMLAEKHSDTRIFCDAAASWVTIECGLMNMPSAGIISKLLEKWWAKNRPPASMPMIEGTEASGLSAMDKSWVAFWRRACAEHPSRGERANALSLVRKMGPAAFEWLLKEDDEAALIALRKGWSEYATTEAVSAHMKREWDDPVGILDRVRTCLEPTLHAPCLRLLSAIVARHAPQHAHLVPTVEAVMRGSREDVRADDGVVLVAPAAVTPVAQGRPTPRLMPDGRVVGALSPEHLRAYREANPTLREVQEQEDANRVVREGRLPWWDEDAV